MKFSVTYPLAAGRCSAEFATRQGLVAFARAAEAAGFDGIGFTDHPAPTHRWLEAGGHDALDPFAALAFTAAVTERVQLIPNVVVLPYRNPFLVAKSAATIDAMSDGRFVLAVGTGYLKGEYRALGVDFDERNDLLDEAIEVMRGVWTTDDFSYEGRNFTARGQTANPKPERPIPIWIGGNSRLSRRRVATVADGWVPFPAPRGLAATTRTVPLETLDDLRGMLDYLWQQVDAAGRDRAEIDVSFMTLAGGGPGDADFNPDTHLEALGQLAELGVTWCAAPIPADSLAHAVEALQYYGESVIQGR
ncbi:MAG: LLM class F420-dependent oxidoreductase [Acidimicrobiaceae bacterium]|nr:LLM class F420-dependent oxidoreductase [Acidimicrobiaceae bacterium]MYB85651.1 LLM class F420-dependent oxidoreductase [Acidimicrobiaceae bacterium]